MKKKSIIITIIAVIIFIIVVVALTLMLLKQKPIEKRNYYTITDNVITEEKAKELIGIIPFSNATIGELKDAYSGGYITKDSIKEMILAMTFIGNFKTLITDFTDTEKAEIEELLGGEGTRLLVTLRSKIDEILESNYNTNISKLGITEIDDKIFYKVLDDKYVAINLNTKSNDYIKDVYGYLIKEENGNLIIEENVLFVLQTNTVFDFYTDTSVSKSALRLESNSYEQVKTDHMKQLAKIIKTYKHTFKKNNNKYYWYSTEEIDNSSNK